MPENTPRSSFLSVTIIVILLLAAAVLGFFYVSAPSKSQLAEANRTIADLSGQLDRMQTDLEHMRSETETSKSNLERLMAENRRLQSQQRDEADQALSACRKQLEQTEAKLRDAQQRIAALEASTVNATDTVMAQASQSELEACRQTADNATVALEEARSEIASLRAQLESAGASTNATHENAALQQRLDALQSDKDAMGGQIAALHKEKQDTADKLAACQEARNEAAQGRSELQSTLRDMKSEYQNLVDSLRKEIDAKSVVIEQIEDRLSINILGEILFSLGSRRLRPEGRQLLESIARNLSPAPGDVVYVIGHTDTVPIGEQFREIFPSNWDLSAARAASVARFILAESDLAPERVAVMGMAENHPIADNDTAEGRARNRRVEILIGPALYGGGQPAAD